MKLISCIERQAITVLLFWLLALAPAIAQTLMHVGETSTLEVEQKVFDTYVWELYSDPSVNFAIIPGDLIPTTYAEFVGGSSGPSVKVLWKEPGVYFFKVTALDAAGCSMNLKIGMIEILNALPTAVLTADNPVCAGSKISLQVSFTGTAPWSFTYTDGLTSWTVTNVMTDNYAIVLDPGPVITTQYWITSVTDKYGTNLVPGEKIIQQINPLPTPSNIYHR